MVRPTLRALEPEPVRTFILAADAGVAACCDYAVVAGMGERTLVRRLDLRVSYPPGPDGEFPGVWFLVDGADLLALAGREDRYVGIGPAGMLTAESDLLPAVPPRRRILYFTGTPDPAERCVTAVISLAGGRVIWADLRESLVNTGDWDDADDFDDIDVDRRTVDSWPLGLPDIVFDAAQYLAEVHRAIHEREWESAHWQTAGLLEDYLRASRIRELTGWFPEYAQPADRDGRVFELALWDDSERNAVVVAITADPGTPGQRAEAMAAQLLATPVNLWPVIRTMQRREEAS